MGDSALRVLFVPGFMQHADAWGAVARALGERYPSAFLESGSHTAEERIEEIGLSATGAVVCGYSMGGRLALYAALAHGRAFAGLVTVGAGAGIDDVADRAARRESELELADWIEGSAIEDVVAHWEAQPIFASQSAELVAAQRPGRLAHAPADLAHLLRSAGQGAIAPVWEHLPGLDLPVLALAGERDERYTVQARRIAELCPRGEAAIVPGAGHAPQLEQPEATAALLLDFLDRHFGDRLGVEVHP